MDFPRNQASPIELGMTATSALCQAMNLGHFTSSYYEPITGKLIIEVPSLDVLMAVESKDAELMAIDSFPVRVNGVSVSTYQPSINGVQYAFASRYFNPWVGIHEDPVNGSSHTILAPYYASRLFSSSSGDETMESLMLAYMASARTGVLGVRLSGSDRVVIQGHAITTLRGSITAPRD